MAGTRTHRLRHNPNPEESLMYIFNPAIKQNFLKCCWIESAFDNEFCDKVISLFNHDTPIEAGVHVDNRLNDGIRKSKITWLRYEPERAWLFHGLWEKVKIINDQRYQFQLTGFLENLQLTLYPPGGHYIWHEDNMEPKFTTRKLSLSLQLSAADSYEGGELVIFPNERPPKTRGTIAFFPSFATHKVEPVKTGERYSLVAWVTGEPFR